MLRRRVLILGAGARVKNDLLPVLIQIGYTKSEVLIVRKTPDQLQNFPDFHCTQFDSKILKEFNPFLIISCLPTIHTLSVIQEVLKSTNPNNLFVDTPIKLIYPELSKIVIPGGIHVLEDNHLVFFLNQLEISKSSPGVIIVRNALFDYHGVALLSKAFGLNSRKYVKAKIKSFLFLIFVVGQKVVIWLGPRNYSKGEMYYSRRKRFQIIIEKYNLKTDSVSPWAFNFISSNFNPIEVARILSENPIKEMHLWKRVALGEALNEFLSQDKNSFLPLSMALKNEIYF